MQKAKAFFYVCAGLFLLALGYHLGANNVLAQSPEQSLVGHVDSKASKFEIVVDRVAYRAVDGLPVQLTGSLPPIPGSSPVLAFGNDNALLASGDVYDWTGSAWRYKGNLIGGPTPAAQKSWGQVKVEHR